MHVPNMGVLVALVVVSYQVKVQSSCVIFILQYSPLSGKSTGAFFGLFICGFML